jgi:hypothetical protein
VDGSDDGSYARAPRVADLARICRALNTVRPSDRADREFLQARLDEESSQN